MLKLILLGIAAYLAYTYFIRPRSLPPEDRYRKEHDDEYVDYEEIKDE